MTNEKMIDRIQPIINELLEIKTKDIIKLGDLLQRISWFRNGLLLYLSAKDAEIEALKKSIN